PSTRRRSISAHASGTCNPSSRARRRRKACSSRRRLRRSRRKLRRSRNETEPKETKRRPASPSGAVVRPLVMVRRLAGALLCLPISGCEGIQSALAPTGPIAREIAALWWGMLIAATLIFALVVALLLYAALRAPERRKPIPPRRLI